MLQLKEGETATYLDDFWTGSELTSMNSIGLGWRVERKDSVKSPNPNFTADEWRLDNNSDGYNVSDLKPRYWDGALCEDADESTFKRGCKFVKKNMKKRCPRYKDICPRTCGVCPCQNNKFEEYTRKNGKRTLLCKWARYDPERCNTNALAKEKCQRTCLTQC